MLPEQRCRNPAPSDARGCQLIELFPEWPGETFPLYAIRPSRRLPPAAVEVFLDFCTEICEGIETTSKAT